jgi:hypothetical protein
MSETVTRWSRELWEAAGEATHHHLARLCPFHSDPSTTLITIHGHGSFNLPLNYNAKGFRITIRDGASESTVAWEPCGHTIVVDGRLDEQWSSAGPVRPDEETT